MTHPRVCWRLALAAASATLGLPWSAAATTYPVTPETNLAALIPTLLPGDEVVMGAGSYFGFSVSVSGTTGNRIAFRAATGTQPIVQGLVTASGSHLSFRGLVLQGGIEVSSATTTQTDVAIAQNDVLPAAASGMAVRVGCPNAALCRVSASTIERNHLSAGMANAQGIVVMPGSSDITIRDNVIHEFGNTCIETATSLGNGGPTVIERNAIWQCYGSGIFAGRDARIRNNVVFGINLPAAIAVDQVQYPFGTFLAPQNVQIVHNTLVGNYPGVWLNESPSSVIVANNAIYSGGAPGATALVLQSSPSAVVTGNVGQGLTVGVTAGFNATGNYATDLIQASLGTPPIDAAPTAGSPLIGVADPAWPVTDDFNAWAREGTRDVGAYRFDPAGNRGWAIQAGIKQVSTCPSSPDPYDPDGDGVTNACDTDDDGDGISDLLESAVGLDPNDPDTDGDGHADSADNCPKHANPTQVDTDGDGRGDRCDATKPLDLTNTTARSVLLERELSLDPNVVGAAFGGGGLPAQYTAAGGARQVFASPSVFEARLSASGVLLVPGNSTGWTVAIDAESRAVTSTWNYLPVGGTALSVATSSSLFAGGISSVTIPNAPSIYCPTPPCAALVPTSPFQLATGRAVAIGGIDVAALNLLPPPNDVFDTSGDLRITEYDLASDPDGEGLATGDELAAGTDPLSADTDGDGLDDLGEFLGPTDPLDPDSDDDGLSDAADYCPTQAGSDPNDVDADHFGDSCDNCPRTHNPDQLDRGGILPSPGNGDGVGDACQSADFNGDGKVDITDVTLLRRALAAQPPGVDPSMPP